MSALAGPRDHDGPAGLAVVASADLTARAGAISELFADAVREGDRVVLLGSMEADAVAALLAARAQKLSLVPIDSSFSLEETAFAINDSRARLVLVEPARWPFADQLRVLTPEVESWAVLRSGAGRTRMLPDVPDQVTGTLHYSAAGTGRPTAYRVADPVVDPQGRRDLTALLGTQELTDVSCVVLTSELSDPAALQLSVAAHAAGSRIAIAAGGRPEDVMAAVDGASHAVVQLSPATALALAKALDAGLPVARPPRLALIAAPGCPAPVTHRLVEAWGPVLRQVYLAPGVGAVAAIEGVDVVLFPGTMGQPLDDPGAPPVRIRGEGGSAVGLIEAEVPAGSGRWTAWGDHGRMERGRLVVLDRHHADSDRNAPTMPQAVEAALVAHPWVADVAVVVRKDTLKQRVIAFVEPTHDADRARLVATLHEELASRFPADWVPARIEVASSLPRTATGKLDRRRLRTFDPIDCSTPA
ncbi:MAG TPA: AMP-binding protein [Nocardioides sp.]|nr:AMP-binding protein [Nocardioides sp.]